jgi:hypothetical protein
METLFRALLDLAAAAGIVLTVTTVLGLVGFLVEREIERLSRARDVRRADEQAQRDIDDITSAATAAMLNTVQQSWPRRGDDIDGTAREVRS